MQRNLTYSNVKPSDNTIVLGRSYINIARDLSRLNSKNEEITTRDGHVYAYVCKITISAAASSGWTFYTAPNTWKMRNAFRKFHAYRDMMFENAGVEGDEMGRYGKTIRPLLDGNHQYSGTSDNTLVPYTIDSDKTTARPYEDGEWTYTKLSTTPIYKDGMSPTESSSAGDDWADNFDLQICEENEFEVAGGAKSSGMYSRVGMIHSYNLDRMEVVTPTTAETLDTPSNPLAALRSNGNQATGEVLDIAVDQELEAPPYDLADDGASIFAPIQGSLAFPTTAGTKSLIVTAPAGLMRIFTPTDVAGTVIEVEVLDKVLCKDLHY
ncbi:MAG: hypothetical protein [Circular genetic element sp.]|nr:MAG: hypothetical protein [Circular genetic element sp.]